MMRLWLLLLSSLISSCFGANGYLTVTNHITVIGAGGGSGASGDGYIARTNRITVVGGVAGGTNDGTFSVTNGITIAPTSPFVPPPPTNDTGIAGMAYFWNYKDLAPNTAVSSWVDRLQSNQFNQGNASIRPTNSSSGVFFDGAGFRLTNVDITLPQAKYSIWISFKATSLSGTYHCMFADKSGGNGFFLHGAALDYYRSGDNNLVSAVVTTTNYDFVYYNPGTGSAGAGVGWTNGVATSTITDRSTAQVFGTMGSDNGNEHYGGYIKYIGVWTNTQLTITEALALLNYTQTN